MILIDCYNVLHTTMPPMIGGLDEGGLCEVLSRTGWATRQIEMTLVADGVPKPMRASVSPVAAVELVFSGPGRSADDVIIARINRASTPRRLTIVSSDREIRAAAGRRRCRSWSSEHFINQLCEQLRPRKNGGDTGRLQVDGLPAEHVEGWMDEMGLTDADTDGLPSGPPPPSAEEVDLDGWDMDQLEGLWEDESPT